MTRRAYPREWSERSGQVNWRDVNNGGDIELESQHIERDRPSPRESRFGSEPNCSVFVQKTKGFGSLGNIESQPTSTHGINRMINLFPKEKFFRYRINFYLKRK